MGNIGPMEIGIVLIIALVVFGPKRLPDLGHSLGKGLREFRKASEEIRQELKFDLDADEPPMVPPATSNGSGSANGAGATTPPGDRDLPPAAGEAR